MTETADGRRQTGDVINLLFVEASLQENDICKEMTSIKPKTRTLQEFYKNLRSIKSTVIAPYPGATRSKEEGRKTTGRTSNFFTYRLTYIRCK